MSKVTPSPVEPASAKANWSDEAVEPDFKPWSAEQARRWREQNPSLSPWRVIAAQALLGLLAALAAWGVTGRSGAGWSVAYGALAVILPAALFARGLMSRFSSLNAATAGFGFFIWEAVKIAASVGMLFAAPRLVPDLDWLAMLIGLILIQQVYLLALLMRPKLKTN